MAAGAPTAEVEPNDDTFQATGPVSQEGLTGALQVTDDADVFLLQLRPQRQVRITYENTNPGPSCSFLGIGDSRWIYYRLTEREGGNPIASGETQVGGLDSETITTPGVVGEPSRLYHLRVNGARGKAPGCAYRVSITDPFGGPTDALDPTPLPALPVVTPPEPNDTSAQAFGPLRPDTIYTGSFETNNDSDMLWVKLTPGTNASFELSATAGGADVSVREEGGPNLSNIVSTVGSENTLLVPFVTPSSGRVRIRLSSPFFSQAGTRWRVKLVRALFPKPARRIAAKKPIKAKALRVRTRARALTARVRLPTAGRLQLRLVGKGRKIGIGRVSASGPRTVSITYRRPARVAPGRYVLEMRFKAAGRRLGVSRARVVFR